MPLMNDISNANGLKKARRTELIQFLMQNPKDHGMTSEILDILFAVTDYQKASIPGGEVATCSTVICLLIDYMTARANQPSNKAGQIDEVPEAYLRAMIDEAIKLSGECSLNRPIKE